MGIIGTNLLDAAAVAVMLVSFASFRLRQKTRTPADRVYMSVLMLTAVFVQYRIPTFRVEMFVTSICMMLASAFVMRHERQLDSLVNAASVQAYRGCWQSTAWIPAASTWR